MRLKNLHPGNLSFSIKILLSFVIASTLPFILLGIVTFRNFEEIEKKAINDLSEKGRESIGFAKDLGAFAISRSSKALDDKSIESIESRALDLSYRIADFLYERDNDLLIISKVRPDPQNYLKVYNNLKREIILPIEASPDDKKISFEKKDNKKGWRHQPPFNFIKKSIPLYKEISFVSLKGMEKIKIDSGMISIDLKDISKKENTYCRAEDYFKELSGLKKGEIYVSRVIGEYVKGWLTKENGNVKVGGKSAYSGKENLEGKKFKGIIRFATPVYIKDEKLGYLTMALDHTHIMEFTDHLVPTSKRYQAIPDASSGDYAWMWDYKGRCISHPRDFFITGFDKETGEEIPGWISQERYKEFEKSGLSLNEYLKTLKEYHNFSLDKKGSKIQIIEGKIPLDCRYLDHAPQCVGWKRNTDDGGTGSFIIFWSGLWKLTAESAIPYYTGQYKNTKTGFGYVTFGADVRTFHKEADKTGKEIKKRIDKVNSKIKEEIISTKSLFREYILSYKDFFIKIFLVTFVVVSILAYRITKRIIVPVDDMKDVLRSIEKGDFSKRVKVEFIDELGKLGKSFNKMADALSESENKQQEYLLSERLANKKLGESIKKRIDAEKKLIENQKNLESIVAERTISLKKANESLVSTVRELNLRRRATMILSTMMEDLQKCPEKEDSFIILGEACAKLFNDFSGAIISYDEKTGYLKPVYQWNSKGVLHGALSVKECPAMLYRACIRSVDDKTYVCNHIERYHKRVFFCSPISNMEENIGLISLNIPIDKYDSSSRKSQETEMTLSSVIDYFKTSYMNLKLKDKLKQESLEDPLTGLFNRRYMEFTLKREISRAYRYETELGVIMLDVDHFKKFNDTYGHETGDKVLKNMGCWLIKNTRKEDIVCRYGGEEFIIILPGIDLENLKKRSESIRKGLAEDVNVKHMDEELTITVSLGACCKSGADLNEDIVNQADRALYMAKELGRNRVEVIN